LQRKSLGMMAVPSSDLQAVRRDKWRGLMPLTGEWMDRPRDVASVTRKRSRCCMLLCLLLRADSVSEGLEESGWRYSPGSTEGRMAVLVW
jgi:hypothetical protein